LPIDRDASAPPILSLSDEDLMDRVAADDEKALAYLRQCQEAVAAASQW